MADSYEPYIPGGDVRKDYLVYDPETDTYALPDRIGNLWKPGGVPITPPFYFPPANAVTQYFSQTLTHYSDLVEPKLWYYDENGDIQFADGHEYYDKPVFLAEDPYVPYGLEETYTLPELQGDTQKLHIWRFTNPNAGWLAYQWYILDLCTKSAGVIPPDEWEWGIYPYTPYTFYQYGPPPGQGTFAFRASIHPDRDYHIGYPVRFWRTCTRVTWPYRPRSLPSSPIPCVVVTGLIGMAGGGLCPRRKRP